MPWVGWGASILDLPQWINRILWRNEVFAEVLKTTSKLSFV